MRLMTVAYSWVMLNEVIFVTLLGKLKSCMNMYSGSQRVLIPYLLSSSNTTQHNGLEHGIFGQIAQDCGWVPKHYVDPLTGGGLVAWSRVRDRSGT
jgi:hypothetical protein